MRRQEKRLCASCDPLTPPRLEHIVKASLNVTPPTYSDNKFLGGEGTAADKTRPDLCWVLRDRVVHVEIDEDSHADRQVECELKKLDSANWGLSTTKEHKKPCWVIRFNCSAYDGGHYPLKKRIKILEVLIKRKLTEPLKGWDRLRTNVCYLFYHTCGSKHITAAKNAAESIKLHTLRF